METIITCLIIGAVIGFIAGVMLARNINEQDRQFWMKTGAESVAKFEEDYGSAQFVSYGQTRYGRRFVRALDHLELGGFIDGPSS